MVGKNIDWRNPEQAISQYFKVKDALYLPSWKVMHIPSSDEQSAILSFANILDSVRAFLKRPMSAHCWIRPVLNNPASKYNGKDYNELVGGAENSAHKYGRAFDFDAGEDCDQTRSKLLPLLSGWNLRMEDNPNSSWVHLDNMPVPKGGRRFFKP